MVCQHFIGIPKLNSDNTESYFFAVFLWCLRKMYFTWSNNGVRFLIFCLCACASRNEAIRPLTSHSHIMELFSQVRSYILWLNWKSVVLRTMHQHWWPIFCWLSNRLINILFQHKYKPKVLLTTHKSTKILQSPVLILYHCLCRLPGILTSEVHGRAIWISLWWKILLILLFAGDLDLSVLISARKWSLYGVRLDR